MACSKIIKDSLATLTKNKKSYCFYALQSNLIFPYIAACKKFPRLGNIIVDLIQQEGKKHAMRTKAEV